MTTGRAAFLDGAGFDSLLAELRRDGYDVYGPQVRDDVITIDRLSSVDQLPQGWTDEQEGGRYRLRPRDDDARFGYAVGPRTWKELLHQPRTPVWTITRRSDPTGGTMRGDTTHGDATTGLDVQMHEPATPRLALVGVRPCELAAIGKQDRVLLDGPHPDPAYRAARRDVFIVAVACGAPAATCFCPSMGTGPGIGPEAEADADLAVTELVGGVAGPDGEGKGEGDDEGDATSGDEVGYVVRAGTERGEMMLAGIPHRPATDQETAAAEQVPIEAAERIGRRIDTDGIRDRIYANLESTQWDELGERCLTCGNCTMACPTCFCTNLEDLTDLTGDHTDRWRVWDSCFSLDFSQLGPRPVRESAGSRYRQWFVHKLASWIDQFDESGCVGCGRCITWCPVGIDLTAEMAVMERGAAP